VEAAVTMRPLRYLPFLALFGGFLLLGLSIGRQLEALSDKSSRPTLAQARRSEIRPKSYQESTHVETQPDQPSSSLPLPTPTQATEIPTPAAAIPALTLVEGSQPVQQNNILVIGVDDLEAQAPRLESAWLVLYIAQTPHFTLMQIYPGKTSGSGDAGSPGVDLASLFQSDPQGSPGPDFFSELKARGLWWSGYIILDRLALAEAIDLIAELSGAGVEQVLSPGSAAVARVPFAWHDPQGAYQGQVELIQKLCTAALNLHPDHLGKLEGYFLLFDRHIMSDIGREQLAAEMVGMLVHDSRITCELPFLDVDKP
jgi:hypothetical protein